VGDKTLFFCADACCRGSGFWLLSLVFFFRSSEAVRGPKCMCGAGKHVFLGLENLLWGVVGGGIEGCLTGGPFGCSIFSCLAGVSAGVA